MGAAEARILLVEDDRFLRKAATIRAWAIARGMKTMFQDWLGKAILGETTMDEVARAAL